LIFSQMLTLYTTPVIYLFFDRLAIRFSKRHREMRAGGEAPSGPAPEPSPAQ
jgi:multidrug efflux pump